VSMIAIAITVFASVILIFFPKILLAIRFIGLVNN